MMSGRLSIVGSIALASFWGSLTGAATLTTDFSEGFGEWVPLASGAWEIDAEDGNPLAALVEPGAQRPPVRRPTAYLFLQDHVWMDVEITLKAKSLEPESVVNRDVVVIFGYIDDTHFYYAHIAASSDDKNHNVIKKVSGDQRTNIDRETLPEARLTDGWHTVRVRHGKTGEIEVFVDDLETPLMTAVDRDYPAGSVAFGCFDDRALFDDVRVEGLLFELAPPGRIIEGEDQAGSRDTGR
ncbi:MAG: hypothetical protein R3F07_16725 [Opitutaceae bacterium]